MNPDDAEEYTQALGQVMAGGWRQIALGKRLGVPSALGLDTDEWVENRLGGYVRLSISERREAALELKSEGLTRREIGEVLGVDHSTVTRDLGAIAPKDAPPEQVGSEETGDLGAIAPEPPADAESPPPPPPDPAEVERARDEQERRQAIARQVNRLRNLIDGWETVTHLRTNPLRDEVLDSIGEYDRNLILRIEEVVSP